MVDTTFNSNKGQTGVKRRVLPSEMAAKFQCKSDILKYLEENGKSTLSLMQVLLA